MVFVALRTKNIMTGDTTRTTARMAIPMYVRYFAFIMLLLTSSLKSDKNGKKVQNNQKRAQTNLNSILDNISNVADDSSV